MPADHSVPDFVQPDPSIPGFATQPSPPPQMRRPPRWRDWRFYVGGLGRVLIAMGVLVLGFVAYQLWGTALQEARAQDALADDFAALLDEVATEPGTGAPDTTAPDPTAPDTTAPDTTAPDTAPPGTAPPDTTAPADTTPPGTAPPGSGPATTDPTGTTAPPVATVTVAPGDAVARLEIPAIGLNKIVVAGVSLSDLKRGPGHYPGTPLPGEPGNAAIAGHRSTYGAPFARINELDPGDQVIATTPGGRYTYVVASTEIVSPSDVQVLGPTEENVLTLTSCHPRFSTRQRIVVRAVLDPAASPPPAPAPVVLAPPPVATAPEPTSTVAPPTTEAPAGTAPADSVPGTAPAGTAPAGTAPAGTAPAGTAPGAVATTAAGTVPAGADGTADVGLVEAAETFSAGWFSDPDAWPQVALWGGFLTAVALVAWAVSRATDRNWMGFLAGVVPFVVVLYFFYENVARLLPPNL